MCESNKISVTKTLECDLNNTFFLRDNIFFVSVTCVCVRVCVSFIWDIFFVCVGNSIFLT